MVEARSRPVQRRLFIHAGGFDPVEPDRLDHRLVGGLSRFAALWGIEAHASAPELSPDGRIMRWDVEAQGPNWKTDTRYIVLRWDDRIASYTRIPRWRKIVDGFSALLHFTFNGTIFRYFAANARYGMFVLYPFLLLVAFAAVSFFAGRWIGGMGFPLAPRRRPACRARRCSSPCCAGWATISISISPCPTGASPPISRRAGRPASRNVSMSLPAKCSPRCRPPTMTRSFCPASASAASSWRRHWPARSSASRPSAGRRSRSS